ESTGAFIHSNVILNSGVAATPWQGIRVESGASNFHVASNYVANIEPPSYQYFGIVILSDAQSFYVQNNYFGGDVCGSILNQSGTGVFSGNTGDPIRIPGAPPDCGF